MVQLCNYKYKHKYIKYRKKYERLSKKNMSHNQKGGDDTCSFKMGARKINYYINFTNDNIKYQGNPINFRLRFSNPVIPYDIHELQTFFEINLKIIKKNAPHTYKTDLEYEQYDCTISNLQYYFKLWTNPLVLKHFSDQSWIYIDYALITGYISFLKRIQSDYIKNRITSESPEITMYKDDTTQMLKKNFYTMIPHHAYFIESDQSCKEYEGEMKYIVFILDKTIDTIYNFTKDHYKELVKMKKEIIEWFIEKNKPKCKDFNEDYIRIYIQFPNMEYIHPFFLVDYKDPNKIFYTRIVDETRILFLDDIIERLEIADNMKLYFTKYYIYCSHMLYKYARTEFLKTLAFYMIIITKYNHLLKKDKNIKSLERIIDAPVDVYIQIKFIKLLRKLNVTLDNNSLIDKIINKREVDNILYGLDSNYENVYYISRILLKKQTTYYSFLTEYRTLTSECIIYDRSDVPEWRQRGGSVIKNKFEDLRILRKFNDFTRGEGLFRMFGFLCIEKEKYVVDKPNIATHVVNFIRKPLYENNECTVQDFPMNVITDDNFADLLDPNKESFKINENIKLIRSTNTIVPGEFYGQAKNQDDVPYLMEVHKLALDWETNRNYKDFVYSYNLEKGVLKLEQGELIKENLIMLQNEKLDRPPDEINTYSFILYKYTHNYKLRDVIAKFLSISYEFIYVGPRELPYIAIPDKSFRDAYKKNPHMIATELNFDYNIWFVDEFIYDESLLTRYGIYKSVQNIIDNLNSTDKYPFIDMNIGKFLNGGRSYPHTIRYVTREQLDKLYVYIHKFKMYIKQSHKFKKGLENAIAFYYFHNATFEGHGTLHLHIRAKKKQEKSRHIFSNYIENLENIKVHELDHVYNKILINNEYYNSKPLKFIQFR